MKMTRKELEKKLGYMNMVATRDSHSEAYQEVLANSEDGGLSALVWLNTYISAIIDELLEEDV